MELTFIRMHVKKNARQFHNYHLPIIHLEKLPVIKGNDYF